VFQIEINFFFVLPLLKKFLTNLLTFHILICVFAVRTAGM